VGGDTKNLTNYKLSNDSKNSTLKKSKHKPIEAPSTAGRKEVDLPSMNVPPPPLGQNVDGQPAGDGNIVCILTRTFLNSF